MTAHGGKLSIKTVWGKVVLYLKEHRQVALHVACGDITDVQFAGDKIVINVNENMILSLLQEGKSEIEKALRWQGIESEVVVRLRQIEQSLVEEDISKLKDVFDEIELAERKQKLKWR